MMERIYTIPLRREFTKVPIYKRSKKAVKAVRQFIMRHMKSENVVIHSSVNEYIWSRGAKNPPARVKVVAKKEDDKVSVVLFGYKPKESKEAPKKKIEKKVETEEKKMKKSEEKKDKEEKKNG
ncbi:hypothetical protein DRN75_01040 [Nanoarchaeota archaeon]|nr:MAG: hypothetical protein DRN75_01040 [Nanoarchaeota archaeon]